jgi:chromosome segregation ATPase
MTTAASRPTTAGAKQVDTQEDFGSRLSVETENAAEQAIKAANEEFRVQTDELLALPISILVQQRDAALRALGQAREQVRKERGALVAEQDNFITFLMEEQEKKVRPLQKELEEAKAQLERQTVLSLRADSSEPPPSEAAVRLLEERLRTAQEEIEEARADACRLQEERDEALRSIDDARATMIAEVQAALDQAFDLQSQLDNVNRELEDARDQARDEAYRFTEELDAARRELDDRNAEVRRLRERLTQLTSEARHSRPPPRPASTDLEDARAEAQTLRKQLIDAKRDLSRVSRELELARSRRASRPAFASVMVSNKGSGPSEEYVRRLTPPGIGAPDRGDKGGT